MFSSFPAIVPADNKLANIRGILMRYSCRFIMLNSPVSVSVDGFWQD